MNHMIDIYSDYLHGFDYYNEEIDEANEPDPWDTDMEDMEHDYNDTDYT